MYAHLQVGWDSLILASWILTSDCQVWAVQSGHRPAPLPFTPFSWVFCCGSWEQSSATFLNHPVTSPHPPACGVEKDSHAQSPSVALWSPSRSETYHQNFHIWGSPRAGETMSWMARAWEGTPDFSFPTSHEAENVHFGGPHIKSVHKDGKTRAVANCLLKSALTNYSSISNRLIFSLAMVSGLAPKFIAGT